MHKNPTITLVLNYVSTSVTRCGRRMNEAGDLLGAGDTITFAWNPTRSGASGALQISDNPSQKSHLSQIVLLFALAQYVPSLTNKSYYRNRQGAANWPSKTCKLDIYYRLRADVCAVVPTYIVSYYYRRCRSTIGCIAPFVTDRLSRETRSKDLNIQRH